LRRQTHEFKIKKIWHNYKREKAKMKTVLDSVSTISDSSQEKKIKHKMKDIIMLVFFAMLSNADDRVEMEVFGKEHNQEQQFDNFS